MPWKAEKNPYKIWLSEIILQQTRVDQGINYYNTFVSHFPSIGDLAVADEKKVFKLWEGLGYYSRCKNLVATAKYIHTELHGKFPDTYESLLKLKGVGPYTAAAIASFAFGQPYAVLDGNVFRIIARIFGIVDAIDSTEGKKKFAAIAEQLLDKKNPGVYNQAIMDFGATVCKPAAPLCATCIFKTNCIAFAEKKTALLPVKKKKIKQRNRFFYFFIITYNDTIAVRERSEKDIWQHLHEFPVIEMAGEGFQKAAIDAATEMGWITNNTNLSIVEKQYTQKLTHQKIMAIFIRATVEKKINSLPGFDWVKHTDLKNISFPKIINNYLSDNYTE